jgi:hypothetical protein
VNLLSPDETESSLKLLTANSTVQRARLVRAPWRECSSPY